MGTVNAISTISFNNALSPRTCWARYASSDRTCRICLYTRCTSFASRLLRLLSRFVSSFTAALSRFCRRRISSRCSCPATMAPEISSCSMSVHESANAGMDAAASGGLWATAGFRWARAVAGRATSATKIAVGSAARKARTASRARCCPGAAGCGAGGLSSPPGASPSSPSAASPPPRAAIASSWERLMPGPISTPLRRHPPSPLGGMPAPSPPNPLTARARCARRGGGARITGMVSHRPRIGGKLAANPLPATRHPRGSVGRAALAAGRAEGIFFCFWSNGNEAWRRTRSRWAR
mmetsp:Transcript_56722/g.179260  ORF Transcript_56722/g.179260 Transcript_56722/m.179260 type:complete len:295 (-) Transcript_56722:70-954(-)